MDRRLTVGGPSTVASLAGYAIGITAAMLGMAFLALVMLGYFRGQGFLPARRSPQRGV